MTYYFDTSAIMKRYIEESGSTAVAELLNKAENVYVSEVSKVECISVLKRINVERHIADEEYEYLKKEIVSDFENFSLISIAAVIDDCEEVIDKYQLKTLDSIQLSSALYVKNEIDCFVCCDLKLNISATNELLNVINPENIK
jgi:uncharacterized protein